MIEAVSISERIIAGGLTLALMLVVISGAFELWVYGRAHRRMIAQNEKLLESLDRLSRSFETLVSSHERERR